MFRLRRSFAAAGLAAALAACGNGGAGGQPGPDEGVTGLAEVASGTSSAAEKAARWRDAGSGAPEEYVELLREAVIEADPRYATSGDAFDRLIDTHALVQLAHRPQALTAMGVIENTEADRHSAALDPTSLAALAADQDRYARWREELAAVDRATLSRQQRLTHDIVTALYERAAERSRFPYAVDVIDRTTYPVDHMQGPQTALPRFMNVQHRIEDEPSAQRYVQRLAAFDAVFAGDMDRVRMQSGHGIVPPRFVIESVLDDSRIFIEPEPEDNALVVHLDDALRGLDNVSQARREALVAEAADVMASTVYPAFEALIALYEGLLPEADNHGVWAFPDGDAFYRAMLRSETTTDLDPETVHRMGVEEVARIESEMDDILRDQGLTDGTPGERTAQLGRDPEHLFSNDDEGRAALIAYLEEIVADMDERQQAWFGTLPQADLVVRRVPEYAEARQTIAYYGRASLDGERPGVYFINLRDTRDMPRWSLPSLSYHEGIPGHHLQINVAQEIEGLPLLRRDINNTAYREGWGLYAERLAWEMGVYDDDPLGNLGRLQYEMWRAVRMVVDTGIHAKRWTREQAIDYFMAKTGMSRTDATVEVERYFVLPGNAPAYQIGMLKIVELRERARDALGDAFSVADYHDEVLRYGPVPLTVLEQVVEDWIQRQLEDT